jgi:hypothetical protein
VSTAAQKLRVDSFDRVDPHGGLPALPAVQPGGAGEAPVDQATLSARLGGRATAR